MLGVGTGKGSSDILLGLGCPSSPTGMLAGPQVPLNGAMCSSFCTFTMASPLELVEAVLVLLPWPVGRVKGDCRRDLRVESGEEAEDFLYGEGQNSPPLLDDTLGFFSSEMLPPADDFLLLLELSWLGSDLTRDSPGSREGVSPMGERGSWKCAGTDGLE